MKPEEIIMELCYIHGYLVGIAGTVDDCNVSDAVKGVILAVTDLITNIQDGMEEER